MSAGIPELMTMKEICEFARCTRPTIYRNIKLGIGPRPVKLHGRTLFKRTDVEEWLNESQVESLTGFANRKGTSRYSLPGMAV